VAIFDVLTRQDGLELPSMEEEREVNVLRVEDAMRAPEVPVVGLGETVDSALEYAKRSPNGFILVQLGASSWLSLARTELEAMGSAGQGGLQLGAVQDGRTTPLLHPDYPLYLALRHMGRWPFVPVVSRANFSKLVGVITESDVLERYHHAQDEDH